MKWCPVRVRMAFYVSPEYYVSIADWILPTLQDRPIALVRAPEGIAGELFFQKNVERLPIPGIETVEGESVMLINNAEAWLGRFK